MATWQGGRIEEGMNGEVKLGILKYEGGKDLYKFS